MSTSILPVVRLEMLVRTEAPLQLPPYAGSMLRGAFVHALMALAPLPHANERACALQHSCPYCQIFATPPLPEHSLQKFSQMPHPYIIEPPERGSRRLQAGDVFSFGLVLIGNALNHLPTVIRAFERALRTGLGMGERPVRCMLLAVRQEHHDRLLWQAGQDKLLATPSITLPPAVPLGQTVSLQLSSPLRLQQHGKPVRQPEVLTARSLLVTLARRYQLLLDVHLGAKAPQLNFEQISAQAAGIQLTSDNMEWFDWKRYSQRQQQEMKLSGLIGNLHLHGELSPFSQLLHLGQWLHVGKSTTFGLGGYRLHTLDSHSNAHPYQAKQQETA